MKAIEEKDGNLVWTEVPAPQLGPDEVRIGVHATAVNRADLVQRTGNYPPPPGASEILGLECSGTVLEVGSDVSSPRVGDEVCALLSGGGYAEEVVLPASHALPIPPGLSLTQAAAVPEVFTTAWLNLRREGELAEGERVLVHAGMSGVGTSCVQLCKAWGNPVVVTVGSEEKCRRAEALGAELAANRKSGPWESAVKVNGKFDVIIDPVGGDYLEQNIRSLNPGGRLVNIGLMGGAEGTLALGPLLTKRLRIQGSVLRSRDKEEKTDILAAMTSEVWPLFESGAIQPILERVMSIEEADEAHKILETNDTIGKIVLEVKS